MLRVPGSCVLYVPEAQGSWCATVRTPYAYQPRACRTCTYRAPCGAPQVEPLTRRWNPFHATEDLFNAFLVLLVHNVSAADLQVARGAAAGARRAAASGA